MSQQLNLSGTGAAYVRVSDDKQDVARQYAAVAAFEKEHGVCVPLRHRYEDHGFQRHVSAKRPAFQRMMAAARAGLIRWIAVDQIERFGFADQWEFAEMVCALRKAECKLYQIIGGDEWTGRDFLSFVKTGFAGYASHDEQVKKSNRALGGMAEGARRGEHQGGPPKLGFDLGCFDRGGKELWRLVYEGRDLVGHKETRREDGVVEEKAVYSIRRRKVFPPAEGSPEGRTERCDGDVVFRTSKDTQVIRLVPTRDPARLETVRELFRRYATEKVSCYGLAGWLNGLGVTNSYGKPFQSRDVIEVLEDTAYVGRPGFGRRRKGDFHRLAGGAVKELEPELRGRETAAAPEDVIRCAERLYEPLVDQDTWDKVQEKLRGRTRESPTPRNPAMYLRGLVYCAHCGQPMVARAAHREYYCGTWERHRKHGTLADTPCQRNGVRQELLEGLLDRFLGEAGRRVELLAGNTRAPGAGRLRLVSCTYEGPGR
jgi:DNA invertase Pin-like site-specific DNA recombinase